MSVTIDNVNIGSIDDKRFTLGNSQAARVISMGSSWNRLRLGVRFSIDDTGANIGGTPRFWLGVMSNPSAGMANGPLGASTSHFIGMRTAVGSWSRFAGPPARYAMFGGTPEQIYIKKVGSTVTDSVSTITNLGYISATPSTHRFGFLLDITKGSPNYSFQALGYQSGFSDVSIATLKSGMEANTIDNAKSALDILTGGGWYVGPSNGSVPVNEGVDGALNAICIAWQNLTPVMRISDFYFAKMA